MYWTLVYKYCVIGPPDQKLRRNFDAKWCFLNYSESHQRSSTIWASTVSMENPPQWPPCDHDLVAMSHPNANHVPLPMCKLLSACGWHLWHQVLSMDFWETTYLIMVEGTLFECHTFMSQLNNSNKGLSVPMKQTKPVWWCIMLEATYWWIPYHTVWSSLAQPAAYTIISCSSQFDYYAETYTSALQRHVMAETCCTLCGQK